MLSWFRDKFKTIVTFAIMGFIVFVFVFSGVFNPKATRGLHEGAVAGKVNGDSITLAEFNRELNQRLEWFKNLTGGNRLTEDQMKAFRVRRSVFDSLVDKKLLVQEADRQGLQASDAEIRTRIAEIPVFQKDGRFDVSTYRAVLQANQLTPSGFERQVREDISVQRWREFFRDRAMVSQEEIKQHFVSSEDKRTVKYVLLNEETGRKGVTVSNDEVDKFLAVPEKMNVVKGQYERKKEKEFKGKSLEAVQKTIARDILASEKVAEIAKVNEKLAADILPLLLASKASDAKLNALLKPYGAEVKTSGWLTQANSSIPGAGDSAELTKDLFGKASPIDATQGGKAKKYSAGPTTVVAIMTAAQRPDLSKLDGEREKILEQLVSRKAGTLMQDWMETVRKRADIEENAAVVSDG